MAARFSFILAFAVAALVITTGVAAAPAARPRRGDAHVFQEGVHLLPDAVLPPVRGHQSIQSDDTPFPSPTPPCVTVENEELDDGGAPADLVNNGNDGGDGDRDEDHHTTKYSSGSDRKESAPIPITYHGGPIITNPINVYIIWYGDWAGSPAVPIVTDLLKSLGNSTWFNIQQSYFTRDGTPGTNQVTYAGATYDEYSFGNTLADADIDRVVIRNLDDEKLPVDPNGVYIVITSKDVVETDGMCRQFCGWHFYLTYNNTRITHIYMGDPSNCLNKCAGNRRVSPNGHLAGDAMASTVAHELAETVSDPEMSGWYDVKGIESADRCEWKWGHVYRTANGAAANVRLGPRHYLLQENWVNVVAGHSPPGRTESASPPGYCSLFY